MDKKVTNINIWAKMCCGKTWVHVWSEKTCDVVWRISLYQHVYCFRNIASHDQFIYPRPKMLACHPCDASNVKYSAKPPKRKAGGMYWIFSWIGAPCDRGYFISRDICGICDRPEKTGLVLLTAEGLSTIEGSSHLTRSLGIHGHPWGSWASKWETYRLSSSHQKHPCFMSTGGMNKDNQRARTNYSWTLDFGKSMIKSDSETFIFHIRQRDIGITWPNHAESGPCYYMCIYIYIRWVL